MAEIIIGAVVESLCSALINFALNEAARKIDFKRQFEQMKACCMAIPYEESQKRIIVGHDDKSVTLLELIRATGDFSNKKMLGSGIWGTVYVANLKDRKVAVKKLFSHCEKRIHELKVETFSFDDCLAHENLIQLLDVHIGEAIQLLVYEYMEHMSLENAICEYEPKLSDFGLTNVYTDEDQLIIIKKETAKGYLAPEYLQLSSPTRETDVYSYGVVLLEIVCGEKNKVSKAARESRHLLNDAHRCSKSGDNLSLKNLVDGRLDNTADEDKQALDVLHLAVMCTDISPSRRPTISQILSALTGKKNIEEIRQSIDDSNKEEKSTADAKDQSTNKNDVSTSKETTSSASTSTALIESAAK